MYLKYLIFIYFFYIFIYRHNIKFHIISPLLKAIRIIYNNWQGISLKKKKALSNNLSVHRVHDH